MSDELWFTEHFESAGTSFGLRVKQQLEEIQTPYQLIEIFETDTFGMLMTIDGCTMVSSRDNFVYHEMMAHPALFTHRKPEKVVIIGGGDCGTLKEVLKHDTVQETVQIDIDEQVTRLSEKYFPELCSSNDDPRATLLFEDGVAWIKAQQEQSVDVIIVDSTDPEGHAEGLFKQPFFEDCLRILKDGGILVQQSESPILHSSSIIKDLHINMGKAGFNQTQTLHFTQPIYPSGWWSCTMASKSADTNMALDSFREQDIDEVALGTQYYCADMHKAALTLPPFMRKALK